MGTGRLILSMAIILATLALSALFLARGTTRILAGSLLPIAEAPAAAASHGPIKPAPGSEPPDPHAILARNIFDPTTGPLWPPKPEEPPEGPAVAEVTRRELLPGEVPPPCENSSLRLIAAVHSEGNPDWSFATLTNGSAEPLLYRQGGRFDDNEVV